MKKELEVMVSELLRAARRADHRSRTPGPAILDSEAAGVFFHEAVGHRLEGERQDDDTEGKTFRGQVGKPVLPPFLSVIDDPTAQRARRQAAQRPLPLRRRGGGARRR